MNKLETVKNRTLPTIIGIVTPVVVLIVGILFIRQARVFQSSASSDKKPLQVKIGNITDTSLVVSWITNEMARGSVIYGETPGRLETSVNDFRDRGVTQTKPYLTHFVLLENLKPNTKFYYRIISAGVGFDNNGQPFTANTSIKVALSDNDIAQGRVIYSDNSPANGALVYFNLANTSPLIGLTDDTGHWMIPLSTARQSDLTTTSNYDRNSQVIDLTVTLGELNASAVLTTKNDNPTPDIVLGQTYNFVDQRTNVPTGSNPNQANNDQISNGPLSPTATQMPVTEIIISYPAKDNEKVTSPLPEFIGTGPAGEKLEVIIHSDEQIKADTIVGKDRSWRWTPSSPLSPGEHTITVSYTDKDGFVKKTTKGFVVLAAQAAENDFLPSFTATGSGRQTTPLPTLLPTAYLQPTATPTASNAATPTPTAVAPTPTASTAVTLTPTATPVERTSLPENQGEVPTSGNWVTTVILGCLGLVVVIAGLAFLIF